jgi:O-acetyl-ADP-ribose deacetylase (regulator of RNase III)
MKIYLKRGDITELEVDGIVNAANNRLIMGGGVAGAIKRKGGSEIEREAVSKGPIPIGEAVVTGAGRLRAKYVIHAATMGMDFKTDGEKIRMATRNAMKRAVEFKMKSVAFPALGTGVGGFPFGEAAKIMYEEVKKFEGNPEAPEKVIFVLFREEDYEKFKEVLKGFEDVEI